MYYQEITMLPDTILPLHILQTDVFTSLHLAFVNYIKRYGNQTLALAFPHYTIKNLGNKIRIFSEQKKYLQVFNVDFVLVTFRDYVHVTQIREVPKTAIKGWESYYRWQPCGGTNRIRFKITKYMQQNNVDYATARKKIFSSLEQLPYIQLKSFSNHQYFSFFIKRVKRENAKKGPISFYGLGKNVAVPIL